MEILLITGIILVILLGLLFLLMVIVFVAMVKGLIKKHPKVDQAQQFIYRIQQTHFPKKSKKNKWN